MYKDFYISMLLIIRYVEHYGLQIFTQANLVWMMPGGGNDETQWVLIENLHHFLSFDSFSDSTVTQWLETC